MRACVFVRACMCVCVVKIVTKSSLVSEDISFFYRFVFLNSSCSLFQTHINMYGRPSVKLTNKQIVVHFPLEA